MPQLPIKQEMSAAEVESQCWWLMLFPDELQTAFVGHVKHLLLHHIGVMGPSAPSTFSVPLEWMRALASGPSWDELSKQSETRKRAGVTAGLILIACHAVQRTKARMSFNTGAVIVASATERQRRPHLGVLPHGSRPQISQSWQLMRTVAHLWAGAVFVDMLVQAGQFPADGDRLSAWLRYSRGYLAWGSSSPGKAPPLLDRAAAWDLPDFVEAGQLITPMEEAALPTWMYRAATDKRSW